MLRMSSRDQEDAIPRSETAHLDAGPLSFQSSRAEELREHQPSNARTDDRQTEGLVLLLLRAARRPQEISHSAPTGPNLYLLVTHGLSTFYIPAFAEKRYYYCIGIIISGQRG